MAEKLRYSREVPVKYDVDVLVVGGGPAGCAAAWAAGQVAGTGTGKSVLLIEGTGALGGMGTLGGVPAFMQFGDGVNFLAGEFAGKLLRNLEAAKGIYPEKIPMDTGGSIAIRAEVLKRVYDQMLLEAGVKISLCTQMIDVICNGRKIEHVICAAKSGLFGIRAKRFIDCSGDGDLCAWAGAAFEKGDDQGNLMPGTLCSLWADIDFKTIHALGLNPREKIVEAIEAGGVFTLPDRHLPGMWQLGPGVGGGNISHAFGLDATDEVSLTHHLIDSRKRLMEYERFYKEYLKGYEKMWLVNTGALMGVRETRRIVCDYMMTLDDFKSRVNFNDEIGRYCYPVDIHSSSPDQNKYEESMKDFFTTYRYERGESYGIPYRSLIPKDLDNALVAGRCIGSDRYIQGSMRVMPGCFITGQAAGRATRVSLKCNCDLREVDTAEIFDVFHNHGNGLKP
ncbi:MAG: FAD-dependent oxidoreductase [Phycisphaerae bacterium]